MRPDNSLSSDAPANDSGQNNIYPEPTRGIYTEPHASPPSRMSPEGALAQHLAHENEGMRIADRLPRLKMSAYILLGLIVFSAVQMFAMNMIIFSMLGARSNSSLTTYTITLAITWVVAAICAIMVLVTRNSRIVKVALVLVGLYLLYNTIRSLMAVDVIGGVIDGFLVWWTYELFQSVEALEMPVR